MLTSNYLLSKTPTLLILLFFYGMLMYGKSKNLDVIGRISEIIIIVSLNKSYLKVYPRVEQR